MLIFELKFFSSGGEGRMEKEDLLEINQDCTETYAVFSGLGVFPLFILL